MNLEMESRDSTLSVDTPHFIVASFVELLLEGEHRSPILEDRYLIGSWFLICPSSDLSGTSVLQVPGLVT